MESDFTTIGQVMAFGLVIIARMHLTSHLARKRLWGFIFSILAACVFISLMIHQKLYILALMDAMIICLDTRGVLNNYREVKADEKLKFFRKVDDGAV